MFGNVILTNILESNNEILDLSTQPKGIYFVRLNFANGKVVSKKVILQ